MNKPITPIFYFLFVVFVCICAGGVMNMKPSNWQATQQTASSIIMWIPCGGIGLLCLFILSLAFKNVAGPSDGSTSITNTPLHPELNDIPDTKEAVIDYNHILVKVKDRYFIHGVEGDRMYVQEFTRNKKPISGKVYGDTAWKLNQTPGEYLGNYVKSKVNRGQSLPK